MEKISRFIGLVTRYADYIARLGMLALMVLVVANVIMRYGWTSIKGTYDYVGLITATSVSAAIAYCAFERGHIEVEILMERLPKRAQMIVGSFIWIVAIGFFTVASWQCVRVGRSMKEANETTMAVYVQLYPFMYILAGGLALLAIAIIPIWIKHITRAVKP